MHTGATIINQVDTTTSSLNRASIQTHNISTSSVDQTSSSPLGSPGTASALASRPATSSPLVSRSGTSSTGFRSHQKADHRRQQQKKKLPPIVAAPAVADPLLFQLTSSIFGEGPGFLPPGLLQQSLRKVAQERPAEPLQYLSHLLIDYVARTEHKDRAVVEQEGVTFRLNIFHLS